MISNNLNLKVTKVDIVITVDSPNYNLIVFFQTMAKDEVPKMFDIKPDKIFTDQLLDGLTSIKNNQSFSDFVIKVQDVSIKCHKLILSSVCPYFTALFNSGMQEITKGEVRLDNLDCDAVKSIVHLFRASNI